MNHSAMVPADLSIELARASKARCEGNVPTEGSLTLLDAEGRPTRICPVKVSEVNGRRVILHHHLPLDQRRAVLHVENAAWGEFAVVVDLAWCRFRRSGQYVSGARFIEPLGKSA